MSDDTPATHINRFQPVFKGTGQETFQPEELLPLPPPPAWRRADRRKKERGATFQARPEEIELVNAAMYLRRPLLVTGKPGTGKTSLAYAIARELGLGEVLYWPITTRSTLRDGLYLYDAIARLQDANSTRNHSVMSSTLTSKPKQSKIKQSLKEKQFKDNEDVFLDYDGQQFENIGEYIRLGPLGTALLPSKKPRVLIVDEIDKSDIDLPNDLLYIFEEGAFEIPELLRIEAAKPKTVVRTAYKDDREHTFNDGCQIKGGKTEILGGKIACTEFPLVILTSNGERDFPPPFLRRCVRLTLEEPDPDQLEKIVNAHLNQQQLAHNTESDHPLRTLSEETIQKLISDFVAKRNDRSRGDLATDQLLNAVYLVMHEREPDIRSREDLIDRLWKHLSSSEDQQSDRSRKR